jgi:hypothetical protein
MDNKTDKELDDLVNGDAFCVLPWIHMHPWPDGRVFTCCLSEHDTPVGNLNEQTLEEVYNSETMKKFRTAMLDNKKISNCNRCYEQEGYGHETLRMRSNDEFMQSHENWEHKRDVVKSTEEDGSVPGGVNMTYVDMRFSNICNMRCRTCGPDLSSQWFNDAVDSKYNKTPETAILQIQKGKTYDFMQQFDKYLPTVEKIYWAGGEPLIMDEHWYIMNKLVENGQTHPSSPMRVFYNTNFKSLTYKDNDAIELWNKFNPHCISIGASLDDSGVRGEYIRKGTIWSETVKNRKRMQEECPKVDFNISCTVGMFNILNIDKFFWEMVDEGFISIEDFGVNILLGKHIHRATVLPERFRKQAQENILRLINKAERFDNLGRTTSTFKSLHKFMEDDMSHLIIPSMREAKELDRFRSESLFEAIPELGEIAELVHAYDNAEELEASGVEHRQAGNFARGEGTVDG